MEKERNLLFQLLVLDMGLLNAAIICKLKGWDEGVSICC